MRSTKQDQFIECKDRLAITTERLQGVLDCGRPTAVEIGTLAKARIEVGRRVLWNVGKIQKYLDSIATE
jgi:hypothetical protein